MSDTLERYHRQMLLPGFGAHGQRRLLASTALVLGCGALGTVIADLLARAGVGHLIVVDRDFIELTNLQRQVLFDERDVRDRLPKAEAARRKLAQINSQVRVTAVVEDLNAGNIERIANGVDVIVDGSDNFDARYLANEFAVREGIPFIYGGAVGTSGMAFAVLPHSERGDAAWETRAAGSLATPCFRCLFEAPPAPGVNATCDTVGVLGPVAAMIANFQVAEALKILGGHFERVCRTLLSIDLWTNAMLALDVAGARDDSDCPCCRHRRFDFLDGRAGSRSTTLCGQDAVQISPREGGAAPDLAQLAARLAPHAQVQSNDYLLRATLTDNGQAYELTVFANGRTIVKGTADTAVARTLHAKYIG